MHPCFRGRTTLNGTQKISKKKEGGQLSVNNVGACKLALTAIKQVAENYAWCAEPLLRLESKLLNGNGAL